MREEWGRPQGAVMWVDLVGADPSWGWGEFAAGVAGLLGSVAVDGGWSVGSSGAQVDPSSEWLARAGGQTVEVSGGGVQWQVEVSASVRGCPVRVEAWWSSVVTPADGSLRVRVVVQELPEGPAVELGRRFLEAAVGVLPVAQGVVHTIETGDEPMGPNRCAGVGVGVWTWWRGVESDQVVDAAVQTGRAPLWVAATGEAALAQWSAVELGEVHRLAGGVLVGCDPDGVVDLAERLAVAGVWAPVAWDPGAYLQSDAEYTSQVAFGVSAAEASGMRYVVDHPDGSRVFFHGHVWRDAGGEVVPFEEVDVDSGKFTQCFVTALGEVWDVVHFCLDRVVAEQVWAVEARRQAEVVPAGAVNEWHTDNPMLVWLWEQLFARVGVPVRVVLTPVD